MLQINTPGFRMNHILLHADIEIDYDAAIFYEQSMFNG
jgi:hypothetical protein